MNDRKRADASRINTPKKAMTRSEHEKKKSCEAERKRKQRAKLTNAELQEINKKRRGKYAAKTETTILKKKRELEETQQKLKQMEEQLLVKELELQEKNKDLQERNDALAKDAIDIRSSDAKRKSLQRARAGMPQRRSHFVSTVIDLVDKSSPKKAAAFEDVGLKTGKKKHLEAAIMDAVETGLRLPRQSLQRKSLAASLSQIKKHKLRREACWRLKISRNLVQKAKKICAGRIQHSPATINLIHEFYEANSNKLPDKKYVSKKSGKPRHINHGT